MRSSQYWRIGLAPIVYGSGSDSSNGGNVVAIGAVRLDRFPPVPIWTLAVPEDSTTEYRVGFAIPIIAVPSFNEFRKRRVVQDGGEVDDTETRVFYATVTEVPIPAAPEGASPVLTAANRKTKATYVGPRVIAAVGPGNVTRQSDPPYPATPRSAPSEPPRVLRCDCAARPEVPSRK